MRLQIVSKTDNLTEELKDFAREKSEHLEHYFDGVMQVQVVLGDEFVTASSRDGRDEPEPAPAERTERPDGVSGHVSSAELVVSVPNGPPLVATGRGEGPRAALDVAFGKMERQLRKHKERLRAKRPRG